MSAPANFPPPRNDDGAGEMSNQQAAMMMKNLQDMEKNAKTYLNEKGVRATLEPDAVVHQATVFYKNCEDGEYVVDAMVTKVSIERCRNCKFTFNGKVLTSSVDAWQSHDSTFTVNTPVKTLQLDGCQGSTKVSYAKKDDYHQLIWAGIEKLDLVFGDNEQNNLSTSFDQMLAVHTDLHKETDQFIARFVENTLLQEQVLRLPNGYPTTERESKLFDEESERAIEALAKEAGITIGRKVPSEKFGRNDPCPCNSGKKNKKCCNK